MTQVSYKGSGLDVPSEQSNNQGQGLQEGLTKINFAIGAVQLIDLAGRSKLIGKFQGYRSRDSKSLVIKSIVFRTNVLCDLIIDGARIPYETLNEYITFNHINAGQISISRDATNLIPDVFDFEVIGSDDPDFSFSIQNTNKNSQTEIVFPKSSSGVNHYEKVVNLRGAKKIHLLGVSPASAETGVATVTCEVFDPASQTWIECVPNQDVFTLIQGQSKDAEIGDTISKSPIFSQSGYVEQSSGVGHAPTPHQTLLENEVQGASITLAGTYIGHVLISGDNIFRIKVVVTIASLTFSIGIIKVFD